MAELLHHNRRRISQVAAHLESDANNEDLHYRSHTITTRLILINPFIMPTPIARVEVTLCRQVDREGSFLDEFVTEG
jgi:hypothetical protein